MINNYNIYHLKGITSRTIKQNKRTGEGGHDNERQTFGSNSATQITVPKGEKTVSK